ncbi:MAG: sulfatase-like hydrolase/transferase, partial [Gammaproteobacteria bacterium]
LLGRRSGGPPEAMLAGIVCRRFVLANGARGGPWLAAALAGCWLGGTAIHVWGDAVGYTPVTQFTRFMPLYYPIHAKRDLARLGLVDPGEVRRQRMLRGSLDSAGGQLRYPLQPMRCRADARDLPNIVFLLIDALRPDAIHPRLTPGLAEFARTGIVFREQFSGGNSSRMGVFSMFYGLPSTYWQSFYDLQRSPVLMDTIRDLSYDIGLFSAVGFGSPTLIDRTVFAGWANLPDERTDLPVVERNRLVTDQALAWLATRGGEQPFFGFVYLDPPMSEMPADGPEPVPMDDRFAGNERSRGLWRQYRLAMRALDGQAGRIFDALRDRGLRDDTIVIVASDHGYEFDDNGIGHYGHASNFSPVQLRSTLLMHWPGRQPAEVTYRTSHHDLPVTLLQEVFGCTNSPREYAIGRNLFSGEPWRWTMAGSYTDHAIVEPGRVIVSHPGGFVEVRGADYRPVSGVKLDAELIRDALETQRRFLK